MTIDEKEFNDWINKYNKEIIEDFKFNVLNKLEKCISHDGLPSDIVWNNAIKIAIDTINETE